MIRSILVPLSPSLYMDNLLGTGVALAKATGARLYGMTVLDLPEITRPQPVPMGAGAFVDVNHEQSIKNAKETLEAQRDRFIDECRKKEVPFDSVSKSGNPVEEIRRESHAHDLILLSRESNFKFASQETPCNTARKVMHHNPRPTIFVPGTGAPGRLLITTDGSSSAARSVQMFFALGLFKDKELDVVSIAAKQNDAEQNCNEIVAFLGLHGLHVTAHPVVSSAKPFQVLLEQVREIRCEGVVMGAFGVSGIKELLFGSATETLLKECTVPLWIYH